MPVYTAILHYGELHQRNAYEIIRISRVDSAWTLGRSRAHIYTSQRSTNGSSRRKRICPICLIKCTRAITKRGIRAIIPACSNLSVLNTRTGCILEPSFSGCHLRKIISSSTFLLPFRIRLPRFRLPLDAQSACGSAPFYPRRVLSRNRKGIFSTAPSTQLRCAVPHEHMRNYVRTILERPRDYRASDHDRTQALISPWNLQHVPKWTGTCQFVRLERESK